MHATFDQFGCYLGVIAPLRQDRQVAIDRVRDFCSARVDLRNVPGVQQASQPASHDAAPHDVNCRLREGHNLDFSGGSSSGRQPPCCGGIPPVPRIRTPAAAIPAIANAAKIRRSSFIAGSHSARRPRYGSNTPRTLLVRRFNLTANDRQPSGGASWWCPSAELGDNHETETQRAGHQTEVEQPH